MTKSQARRSTNLHFHASLTQTRHPTLGRGRAGCGPPCRSSAPPSELPSFLSVPPPQGTRVCVDVTRAEKRSELARKRRREREENIRKINQSVHFAECLQTGDRGRLKPNLIFSGLISSLDLRFLLGQSGPMDCSLCCILVVSLSCSPERTKACICVVLPSAALVLWAGSKLLVVACLLWTYFFYSY